MRAIRFASTATVTALGVVLTAVGTPAWAADGDGGSERAGPAAATAPYAFSVTPSSIAAGGQVTLGAGGCPGTATVSSAAFGTVVVEPGRSARATVGRRVDPGALYDVAFNCGGSKGSLTLTIAGTSGLPTTSSTSLPTASASPVTSPSPVTSASAAIRGVRGGLGGSIGGMDTTQVAGGAALVAVAAAGSLYAVRRRSAGSRRH
ncbi:hypothetical protein ACFYVL_36945 [Streptomyces sp. NPDC004111]|uniref:hypothetical protein n=1 Tax=Streptomyces sp. NPDC004111 TaxID=3364690 RepID=UPI0036968F39